MDYLAPSPTGDILVDSLSIDAMTNEAAEFARFFRDDFKVEGCEGLVAYASGSIVDLFPKEGGRITRVRKILAPQHNWSYIDVNLETGLIQLALRDNLQVPFNGRANIIYYVHLDYQERF